MDKKLDIKNPRFKLVDSTLKGYKEVEVVFNYNGEDYKHFIFIDEGKNVNYINEAKRQFNQDVKSGKMFKSIKPSAINHRPWLIACASALGIATITFASLFTWKALTNGGGAGGDTCLVNFNTDGGNYIASQEVKRGGTATKPDDPTKDEYYFRGWTLDDNAFDFNTPINKDITLTADWSLYEHDYDDSCPYLTFNAEEDSEAYYKIKRASSSQIDVDIEYSTDMNVWKDWAENDRVEIKKGNKIYVRNEKDHLSRGPYDDYVNFCLTGKIAASGDISSLTKDPKIGPCEYSNLFFGCINLIRAPKLPSTVLADSCYFYMFGDCINLREAPELPATDLSEAPECYESMFDGCRGLLEAPKLPATKLSEWCYSYMFDICSSLKVAPELPATDLSDCDGCYCDMFYGCTSLKKAPSLPATALAVDCYNDMFSGCISLIEAPEKLPAQTLFDSCYKWMFENCSSLLYAPKLPATTLAVDCYNEMFSGCTYLRKIEVGFGTAESGEWPTAQDCTKNWLLGAGAPAPTPAVFVWKGDGTKLASRDGSTVPDGWTIETAQQ